MEERVVLLDAQGQPCGTQEKMQAHYLGQLHLAFSVLLYRQGTDGFEFLLQRRDVGKYHSGGLWTNTCCSHPRLGELPTQAGVRRLQEEMGIALNVPLVTAAEFVYRAELDHGLVEHEWDHVLVAEIQGELPVEPNPDEVMAWRWWPQSELESEIQTDPLRFTAWFPLVFFETVKFLTK